MPLFTLMHGGLTVEKKHYPHGSEVELSTEEAAKLNLRGLTVKLSAHIKAEAEAEAKKVEHLAKLTAKLDAELAAETKKASKEGAK